MLGTGIPAHARNRVYKSSLVPVHFDWLTFYVKYCIRYKLKSKGFEKISLNQSKITMSVSVFVVCLFPRPGTGAM